MEDDHHNHNHDDDDNESSIPGHKLCGFLCAVLSLKSSSDSSPPSSPPSIGERLQISRENGSVAFSSGDSVLVAIVAEESDDVVEEELPRSAKRISGGKRKKGKRDVAAARGAGNSRRRRSAGMVKGSVSVLEQIHSLVARRCIRISARLVWAGDRGGGGGGEVRAVVLVDVFLPLELWDGWQFPKSGSVAVALFRHLSCDWGMRSSIIASQDFVRDTLGASTGMWDLSDCHVLGCKTHCNATDSSKKNLYELHEIFKGLPSVASVGFTDFSRVEPAEDSVLCGIWELSDDILMKVLTSLGLKELLRTAATCRHLRFLTSSIMPSMKLNLFPHQQAAVQWMLQREQHPELLPHPLYSSFSTEDGFSFHMSTISGEIVVGPAPTVKDFHGGMFCDEPGLGKTITALSLVLKTQGKFADPPDGAQVTWCTHNGDRRCGYYDLCGAYIGGNNLSVGKARTSSEKPGYHSSKRAKSIFLNDQLDSSGASSSEPPKRILRCTRGLNSIKKNLYSALEEGVSTKAAKAQKSGGVKRARDSLSGEGSSKCRRPGSVKMIDQFEYNDTWVQCDLCRKWRKLQESRVSDASTAWFCTMNSDPLYQNCRAPEETYDTHEPVMHLLGFYTKGTSGAEEQNISFFSSVLKEHNSSINSSTKKALSWLVKLSPDKLFEMETVGIQGPFVSSFLETEKNALAFQKVFKSFGLRKGVEKGITRWHYPRNLLNLAFDVDALRIALCMPIDSNRLYLSKATLVVVPANLVDHWKSQIQKHVRPGQLKVYIWTDLRRPSVHTLAWDYDVVITTFSRLSAEWGPQKKSAMMQVHWLRVILDEGHTLGSSVGLTNKMQMAVSLVAANRWILTGTPTPNTPNSQLSHLQPLLKFLHEEAYGQNQKSWEAGILRPFEAEMEEGRSRLLHLLHRCMISARKVDLKNIPPCIKKFILLDFTVEHARSYNELAVTVRRNILMADWNDPSHVESLLNPKQWKFRSTTTKNIRLSCCVSGQIKVQEAGNDIQETMDDLVQIGLDPMSREYALIKYYLQYGGDCVRCSEWCRLPVITPCMHLLCLDCVSLDSERCTYPGCGNMYEMQTPDTLARPENPNPKWPVPKNLIELQPSYKQDDWDPDWQSTSSSKVAYLISRLKELQGANSASCLPKHDGTDVRDIQGMPCPSLMRNSKNVIEKVLVFSQFLEHIHVIEQQLSMADIKFAGMYSPMHASNKMKSLNTFQNDATCMVLVMDGSAALGLDLSFVSHVFLMEPIWDKSMEEQVISRAHRMGATRPINVETLAMRSTIEEHMVAFLEDANECRRILKNEVDKTESEGARTHRSLHDFAESNYLSQLTSVRTNSKI